MEDMPMVTTNAEVANKVPKTNKLGQQPTGLNIEGEGVHGAQRLDISNGTIRNLEEVIAILRKTIDGLPPISHNSVAMAKSHLAFMINHTVHCINEIKASPERK